MESDTNLNKKYCNCRNKSKCPLDGKSLVQCIVYESTVSTTNQTNTCDFEVILKEGTTTIHYRFIQKDINTALRYKNIFGP